MNEQATAHGTAESMDNARLRALSTRQRDRLIEAACEAAAMIYRSRLAAGLPEAERNPWPESTWEFFRRHAARVRSLMMFFRRRDLADVEQILRTQGILFDSPWVRKELTAMYGTSSPRISAWDALAREISPE